MTPAEFAALAYALVAANSADANPTTLTPGLLDGAWMTYQNYGSGRPALNGARQDQSAPSAIVADAIAALGSVGVFLNA
jgi:hypothetical protein